MQVNYSVTSTPPEYKCRACGITGVKLWREYQTFAPRLLCARCAATNQKKSIADPDETGRHLDQELGIWTDQIGWYVPAIPDEEGVGYWGYTSVPVTGIAWWRRLPSAPPPAGAGG